MKKVIQGSLLLVALSLFSCEKGSEGEAGNDGIKRASLTISTGSYGGTKAVEGNYAAAAAAINTASMRISTLNAAGGAVGNPIVALKHATGTNYEFSVPASTAGIGIEANFDGLGALTDDVNSRQGGPSDAVVRLIGSADITTATDTNSDGDLNVAAELTPDMARIQIVDDLSASTVFDLSNNPYSDVTITAIYVHNVKIKRGDANYTTSPANDQTAFDAIYTTNTALKTALSKSILTGTTLPTNLLTEAFFGEVDGAKQVVGFNIYPHMFTATTEQATAAAAQPNIIIEFTAKKGTLNGDAYEYPATTSTHYISLYSFKNAGAYTSFEAGNVYNLNLSQILQFIYSGNGETAPITTVKKLDMTLTIGEWVIKPIVGEL